MSQERADTPLTVACLVSYWLLMPFCPGAARKGCLCRKAAPRVLSAHHPALSLLDVWLDLLLGLLGTEPSSLLPEPGVEHRLCVCVCVSVDIERLGSGLGFTSDQQCDVG